MICFSE